MDGVIISVVDLNEICMSPQVQGLRQMSPSDHLHTPAIALPEDDRINRAVNVLDHTPLVDLHKIGVVYVTKGQTTETSILSNEAGAPMYSRFLDHLGTRIKLKGCTDVYTGGLDTTEGLDGAEAIFWRDSLTQVQTWNICYGSNYFDLNHVIN
jgi:hypothetical protein